MLTDIGNTDVTIALVNLHTFKRNINIQRPRVNVLILILMCVYFFFLTHILYLKNDLDFNFK